MTTDENAGRTQTDTNAYTQRYRLTLEQVFSPRLILSAGGNFEWLQGTTRVDGVRSEIDSKTWNGFASLRLGARPLSGGLDYTRREQVVDITAAPGTTTLPSIVRETYGASLAVTPADLPALDLQLSRADTYDKARAVQDVTTDTLNAGLRYAPVKQLDLAYGLALSRADDKISGVETSSWSNSFNARYGDSFGDGRLTTYLNYSASTRQGDVSFHKPGAFVTTQQFPTSGGGYSKIETPADAPTRVILVQNPDLVDGNVAARAGLSLGYGASAVGDRANRDIGAQFPNVVTPVDLVYVYVDKSMPESVARNFLWTAYRSDDNQTGDWTPVGTTGTATFDPLLNRFQIPIARTAARYLKVVTQPLNNGVTTDPTLQEINVTEIQFYSQASAAEARSQARTLNFSETVNGTAKLLLVRKLNLAFDTSGQVAQSTNPSLVTWAVTNGIGLSNPITPTLSYAARVDRSDSDPGQGHVSQNRWSASLTDNPLPTIGGTLTYSGQISEDRLGTASSNALNAFAHADLYEGITVGATGAASVGDSATGRHAVGASTAGSLSLVPNRTLTVSGTITYSWAEQTGGGQEKLVNRTGVVEGSASFSPFPALALAGALRRIFMGDVPTTTGSLSVGVSPLRGGDLQARYAYSATFDTASRSRSNTHGPTLRWNIRPGWYAEGGAQWSTTTTPAQSVDTTAYFVNLVLNIK